MLKAYDEDKDLYAVIGSKVFKTDYESCLEFRPALVEDESHEEIINIDDKKCILYNDDILMINGIEKEAINIAIGDKLISDENTELIVNNIKKLDSCRIEVEFE